MDDELGISLQPVSSTQSILRAFITTLFGVMISLMTTLILVAIGLIPVAGAIISLILGILIQGFLAGWGFFDPVFERLHYPVSKSLPRALKLHTQIQTQGIPFVLLFQIPIIGWALAPTYGTLAGVWYACQLHKQQKLIEVDRSET